MVDKTSLELPSPLFSCLKRCSKIPQHQRVREQTVPSCPPPKVCDLHPSTTAGVRWLARIWFGVTIVWAAPASLIRPHSWSPFSSPSCHLPSLRGPRGATQIAGSDMTTGLRPRRGRGRRYCSEKEETVIYSINNARKLLRTFLCKKSGHSLLLLCLCRVT